jgi:hypothetical protein
LRDPELIKMVTVKDFDHFLDRQSPISEDAEPLFGKGLFNLKGNFLIVCILVLLTFDRCKTVSTSCTSCSTED